jgi:hypothetical protein
MLLAKFAFRSQRGRSKLASWSHIPDLQRREGASGLGGKPGLVPGLSRLNALRHRPPGYLVHPGGLFWEVRKVRISANARRRLAASGKSSLAWTTICLRPWYPGQGKIKLPPGLVLSFPMGAKSEAIGFPSLAMPPWLPMEVRRVQRHGGLVWIHPIGTGGDDQAGRSPARLHHVQPTAAAASSAVRVPPGKVSIVSSCSGGEQRLTHTGHRAIGIAARHTLYLRQGLAGPLYPLSRSISRSSSSSASRSLTAPE